MATANESLRVAIEATPDLPILVIAFEFPDFLAAHRGPIVYIGAESPKPNLACRQLIYRCAPERGDVLQAFAFLRRLTPPPQFDLVFIDHNHALDQLIEQINGAADFTHAETLYLFDDAVPPELAMTGPAPTQNWWVGEVWMLAVLLPAVSGARTVWVIPVEPTGLLGASGVGKLSTSEVADHYHQLSQLTTLEELLRRLPLMQGETSFFRVRAALRACIDRSTRLIAIAAGSEHAETTEKLQSSRVLTRPPLTFVLDLSDGEADVSSLHDRSLHVPGMRLDTYSDALLTGLDSFVTHDTFYCRKIESAPYEAERIVRDRDYSRSVLQMEDGELLLPHAAASEPIDIDARVFFGTPDEPDNWGMWILYIITSVAQFLERRDSYDYLLTYQNWPWQRRMLQHLGLSTQDVLEHRLESTYLCRQLSVIRYEFRNLAVNDVDLGILRGVRARFEKGRHRDYGERIYIARNLPGNAQNGRRLTNEEALAEKLTQRGFTVVQPETLDFAEQVRAFSGARTIVGLGGAGMFSAVFAQPGAQVIAIESSMGWVASHVNMFTSCGLNCGVVIGKQDLGDPAPVHKRWSVDVNATIRKIDAYLT